MRKNTLIKIVFCLLVAAIGTLGASLTYAQTPDKAETEKWREDLRFMAAEMPKRHKDLFHQMTRAQFDAAVQNLDARIPQLARNQIIVEMMRIVAMVGDGHTNLYPTRDPKVGFHVLPVKLYLFSDGLFIRSAKQQELVGARVVKIGGVPADEAISKVRDLIGRDNEMDVKYFAPQLLAMPEILQALGLSSDIEKAVFVIEKGGTTQSVMLNQDGLAEAMPGDTDMTLVSREGWTDLRDTAKTPVPLWLKDPADKFRFEMLPDNRTLYVQLNQVGDKDNETLAAFSERVSSFIEASGIEKLVLDLRLNRGGNGERLPPFVAALIRSKLNKPGKFFTIIGRSTFSAAQFLVNDLERYTNTIFVGEPSGSKGNIFGDSRRIFLPNSAITVRTSVFYWQDWHPLDTRKWTAPEVTTELSSEDYRLNVDPALNAIANYSPGESLTALLERAFSNKDSSSADKIFRDYRAKPINKYRFLQSELFSLTNRLLRENKGGFALQVLKWNTEIYPESIFGSLSLGDLYVERGEKALARDAFSHVLVLDPRNTDAIDKLKALGN